MQRRCKLTLTMRSGVLLTAMVLSTVVYSQTDAQVPRVSFRGNSLGMTLEEFRLNNSKQVVSLPTVVTIGKRKKETHYYLAHSPFCSDSYPDKLPHEEMAVLKPGEILCDALWNDPSRTDLSIADVPVRYIAYHFFNGRLVKVSVNFMAHGYFTIAMAFEAKYGSPTHKAHEGFQNAYGASWTGEAISWNFGSQLIVVREGSGNGPLQNGLSETGYITIEDSDRLPSPSKVKVDF